MSDRGVSEVLGFVLVFALVTGTIGIVYATGFSGLEGAQQEERVQNVQRAFDVFDDNVEDLVSGEAPSRATEVKLAGGSVGMADPVTFKVEAEEDGNAANNLSRTVVVNPVVYDDDEGTAIVYTSGTVLRGGSGGAVMVTRPRWVVGPNQSVVPIVDTVGTGGGIGGTGAVLVVAQRQSKTLHGPLEAAEDSTVLVNVTVTSPRVGAWKRYFEDQGFQAMDPDVGDDTVTYRFETDTLYVPRVNVDVTFER